MKSPLLSFLPHVLIPLLITMGGVGMASRSAATDIAPPSSASASTTPISTHTVPYPLDHGDRGDHEDQGDAAPENPTNAVLVPSPSVPTATPAASVPPSAPLAVASQVQLISRDLPEIHAKILLPKEWTLLPGKLLEGDVLLATREKITGENDPWTTGLSMTVDRNGAKDSKQKASEYAMGLAREASEKAGEEATPLKESRSGPFHEIRFDFPVAGDPPILVTEVLRSNDATGTLVVILWQSPKEEAGKLQRLKESILAGLKLDPTE